MASTGTRRTPERTGGEPPGPPHGTPDEIDHRLRPVGRAGHFAVELDPGWHAARGVLGGSLVAVAVRAIEAACAGRSVRTVATSFFRPGVPGPAELTVEQVHESRSVASVVATITQGERPVAVTRATLVGARTGSDWATPAAVPELAPQQCAPIDPPDRPAAFDRAVGVLDPSSLPFSGQDAAVVRGYVRPHTDRPIDAAWLTMICDWFPPPAFVRVAPPTGGISVDLVTHVHTTLPSLGGDWLAAEFRVDQSRAGLAVEHGWIATRDGRVLAESFHTRWTAAPT